MSKVAPVSNNSKRIGKNIKSLRTAFGETQLELAMAIGLDSPNAIANYEKGERNPKPEIRKKIADHFRVTEEELNYSDFSEIRLPSELFYDKENMISISLTLFPIMCSEDAMKDSDFQRGYEAHLRALEAMKSGKVSDADQSICVNAYSDSYNKNKTLEAAANYLWWLLIEEINIYNEWMIEAAEALNIKHVKSGDLLKSYYLRDMSEEYELREKPASLADRLNDIEEEIILILKELKSHSDWSSLADYYLALRYVFGCVNDDLGEGMSRLIGREMMWAFMQLGNEYAKQFFLTGIKTAENLKKISRSVSDNRSSIG